MAWKRIFTNLKTNGIIFKNLNTAPNFVYRVNGENYYQFASAVIATEEFNNADGNLILLRGTGVENPLHMICSDRGHILDKSDDLSLFKNLVKIHESNHTPYHAEKRDRLIAHFQRTQNAKIEQNRLAKHREIREKIEAIKSEIRAQKLRDLEAGKNPNYGAW